MCLNAHSVVIIIFIYYLFETGSLLWSPSCPRTCFVNQSGFEFTCIHLPLPHAGINGVHHDAGFKLSFVERLQPAQSYTKPLWSWLFTERLHLPCYFQEFKSSLWLSFYLSTPFLSEHLDQALPFPAASIVSWGLFVCLLRFFFRLFSVFVVLRYNPELCLYSKHLCGHCAVPQSFWAFGEFSCRSPHLSVCHLKAHTPYHCHKNQEIIVRLNLVYLRLTSFVGKGKWFWPRIQPGLHVTLILSCIFRLPVICRRSYVLDLWDRYWPELNGVLWAMFSHNAVSLSPAHHREEACVVCLSPYWWQETYASLNTETYCCCLCLSRQPCGWDMETSSMTDFISAFGLCLFSFLIPTPFL